MVYYKKHGTYTDNNYIYLVDLMFMYIKHIKSKNIKVGNLIAQLKKKDWGDISPMQVIKNKNVSLSHYNGILNADLRYPIIITKNYKIIDGMHRLAKAFLLKKEDIRAYILDKQTMKKFIISTKKGKIWRKSDWNYYESLTKKDVENLYKERFDN